MRRRLSGTIPRHLPKTILMISENYNRDKKNYQYPTKNYPYCSFRYL